MNDSDNCEFPDSNPPSGKIRKMLDTYRTIAVVGLSDNPDKDSYRVAKYLKEHGYRIIPVNPSIDKVLGEQSYPDLKSIPSVVDIVDIFRKQEAIPGVVDEAIHIGAKVVWMQLGLSSKEASRKAREAGLEVVQSKCIKVECQKFGK